ncbi:MAG: hypothetical protein E4H32_02510, partial [Nitrospirales bacterium]
MRVHEIAKKLGMESRLVIPELVRLGIQVTSHSNAVEDDAARWAMDVLQGKVAAPTGISSAEGVAGKGGMKKPGGRLLKKDGAASGKGDSETQTAPQQKPEKKLILIKKKKTEEELAAEAQEFPSIKEASEGESRPVGDVSASLIDVAAVGEPAIGKGALEASQEVSTSIPPESAISDQPVLPSAQGADREKKGEVKADKKGPASGRDAQAEDKIKKPKKGVRLKNDEMFAAKFEDAAVWQDLRP